MAKRPYSLDFSIVRDTDRLHAVEEILDTLNKDPSATELEQMASYILYGKDENGQNSIQRNETIDKNKRYKSYKTKDDKVRSLDEIMENPTFDEQQLRSAYKRSSYVMPRQHINRPRYDRKTGALIDPGDSEIPGMVEQWEIIDRWQRMLDIAQGRIVPTETDTIITDPYRIYQLKHNLIDLRRHQYYLKDSYSPEIHFSSVDHPKAQFYDWTSNSQYWMTREQWEERVNHSYTSRVSKDIRDYEVREDGLIKWVVCEHTFDWENPKHVRCLLTHYHTLYEALHDKIDTYGRILLWDFDRYVQLCDFSDLRLFVIDLRKQGMSYDEIREELLVRFNMSYSPNYMASIMGSEIPNKIARVARMHRLEIETPPSNKKVCRVCERLLPKDTLFFSRNSSRKDGLAPICKQCERNERIRKGVTSNADLRTKDPTMH